MNIKKVEIMLAALQAKEAMYRIMLNYYESFNHAAKHSEIYSKRAELREMILMLSLMLEGEK